MSNGFYNDGGAVFKQRDREFYLIAMMKVNFLKRLESSVKAFEITMDRTVNKIDGLLEQLRDFIRVTNGSGEESEIEIPVLEMEAMDDEDLQNLMQIGKNRVYNLTPLDVMAWMRDLDRDREQLISLHNNASAITKERDAKLAKLKALIQEKATQPTLNREGVENRKVLVFTAFADTAIYLYEALQGWAKDDLGIQSALVTGNASKNRATFGKADYNQILTNFSPLSKRRDRVSSMDQSLQIDLLIATDCISEGQNLQDCDYLVNYDIHWNPVRIIQRFGRIDRIGSRNQTVQMVNFWPTEDLDQYIGLQNRVEARMALVDATATQEDNLLADEESAIRDELRSRDRQLLRLKDEVLDLEDFDETVSLTDFTLDDFRIELSRYIEANRQVSRDAPLGLYAIVPTNPEFPVIQPGVIFCLKQVHSSSASQATKTNPLGSAIT